MIAWTDSNEYFAESPQHSLLVFYDDDPLDGGTEQFSLLDQTVAGTAYIDYACVALQKLELGTTIATEFGCSIFTEGIPSGTKLKGMWVKVYSCISYTTPINANEWNCHGIFQIDCNPKYTNVLSMTALDHFVKMDDEIPLTEFTTWAGDGKTASQYFSYICDACGVTGSWTSSRVANKTKTYSPPDEQGMTYRQLLGWLFAVMGVIGYFDNTGTLRYRYPDRNDVTSAIAGQAIAGKAVVGASTDATQPYDISFDLTDRFSSEYQDEVEITGTGYTDYTGDQTLVGATGYIYDMSYNPFADYEALTEIYGVTKGIKYNPMNMTTVPCPWITPMDWVRYTDVNGNYHYGVVTNATHHINGHSYIVCEGEV